MLRSGTSHRVPTYALYGEHQPWVFDWLHCESIAERSRLHDWEIKPHRHELFIQILIMQRGSGEALHGEHLEALQAPCVVFVPPLISHGFRFSPDVDGAVITVLAPHFNAMVASQPQLAARFSDWRCRRFDERAGVRSAATLPGAVAGQPGLSPRDAPQGVLAEGSSFIAIDSALRSVIDEFSGNAPWRHEAIDASLKTAVVMLGRAMPPISGEGGSDSPPRLAHLQRFRHLLDASFRSERAIGFYAERLGMTPTHLNRLCRQALGRSALGAINARLVIEAERDLAYTALSVKAIALSLGFADAGYFTRFFARQTGRSPSEFRRAAHEQLAAHRPRSGTGEVDTVLPPA
ncbi:MAG: helix-turn-helix protein [Rhizobacter sp.]|nr:helix-turn-helix protein [Rhizobacter sp.]